MDFLEPLNSLVENAGILGALILLIIILLISMVSMFTKRLTELTGAISTLTDKVSSPHLDAQQSAFVFKAMATQCVNNILRYLGEVLDRNSIQERRGQIEKNLEREIKGILAAEAHKLSTIKSVCGDMGNVILKEMVWEDIEAPLFEIFFSDFPIKVKIQDIKILLNGQCDSLLAIIQDNGIHNN